MLQPGLDNSIMDRWKVGIIALILLIAAGVLFFWKDNPLGEGALAACVRVGLVMAAIWLAFPRLHTINWWLLAIVVVVLFAVAGSSSPVLKMLCIFAGLVVIALMLPRLKGAGNRKKRPARRRETKAETRP